MKKTDKPFDNKDKKKSDKKTLKQVAINNKPVQNGHLKKRVTDEDLISAFYECCGIKSDIALTVDISRTTLDKRLKESANLQFYFADSQEHGKDVAENSLFKRINGYSHPEDKIFNNQGVELVVPTIKHYPPDTTAAIFWLKNRQKDNWRDKQEVDTNVNMNINNLTDDELDAKIQALMNGNS